MYLLGETFSQGVDPKLLFNQQYAVIGADIKNGRLPTRIGYIRHPGPPPFYVLETPEKTVEMHFAIGLSIRQDGITSFHPRESFFPTFLVNPDTDIADTTRVALLHLCTHMAEYQRGIASVAGSLEHQQEGLNQWRRTHPDCEILNPYQLETIWQNLADTFS